MRKVLSLCVAIAILTSISMCVIGNNASTELSVVQMENIEALTSDESSIPSFPCLPNSEATCIFDAYDAYGHLGRMYVTGYIRVWK